MQQQPGLQISTPRPQSVGCMTLVYSASVASLPSLLPSLAMADTEFDTLELRGRSVTETLSPLEDLGQDKQVGGDIVVFGRNVLRRTDDFQENTNGATNGNDEKYDKLELRNRTVTETMSLVKELGQDKEEEEEAEAEGAAAEVTAENGGQFDKLELRSRTVTETLSLVADLGQDKKEEEEKSNGEEFDKLELRGRTVTETLSRVEDFGQNQEAKEAEEGGEPGAKKQKFDTLSLRGREVTETLSPLDN